MGVPPGRIRHQDFDDGRDDGDPASIVQTFLAKLPGNLPDALLYYCGPSTAQGHWALSWRRSTGDLHPCLLDPSSVRPPAEVGSPGARFVVADAPFTSRMWLQPLLRLRGLAAWQDGSTPGTHQGPPLARWLQGQFPLQPEGAVVFPTLPPDAGLLKLPVFKPLFWGSADAAADTATYRLWEIEEFLGAPT